MCVPPTPQLASPPPQSHSLSPTAQMMHLCSVYSMTKPAAGCQAAILRESCQPTVLNVNRTYQRQSSFSQNSKVRTHTQAHTQRADISGSVSAYSYYGLSLHSHTMNTHYVLLNQPYRSKHTIPTSHSNYKPSYLPRLSTRCPNSKGCLIRCLNKMPQGCLQDALGFCKTRQACSGQQSVWLQQAWLTQAESVLSAHYFRNRRYCILIS